MVLSLEKLLAIESSTDIRQNTKQNKRMHVRILGDRDEDLSIPRGVKQKKRKHTWQSPENDQIFLTF